jgi:DNA modification methylase
MNSRGCQSKIWTDIYEINSQAAERLDYPTQKPAALLERIIKASSEEGDLIADFLLRFWHDRCGRRETETKMDCC